MAFRTEENVLFREVSLIQRCPYREVPLYTNADIPCKCIAISCIMILFFVIQRQGSGPYHSDEVHSGHGIIGQPESATFPRSDKSEVHV